MKFSIQGLTSIGIVNKAKDPIIDKTERLIPVQDKKDVKLDTLKLKPNIDVDSLICIFLRFSISFSCRIESSYY